MATSKKSADKAINPDVYDVVRSPVVTEKSTIANELGKYVFKVAVDAGKPEIKTAIEQIFGVQVTKVNTINYDGKIKRFRGKIGQRPSFKKAVVTLKEGQSIDLSSGI
jgi:large subunit ribosomal protein L23